MTRTAPLPVHAWRAIGLVLAVAVTVPLAAQPPKAKPIWARNNPLPKGLNVGEAFPTLALPSAADGHAVSVADFRGKKLIVNIFASW
jgi:hypothetical protein